MQARLVTQPFEDSGYLYDFFLRVAEDEDLPNLTMAVAWVKASGLTRVRDHVASITKRGHSSLILGIDEQGASEDGLRLALELFSECFVFHIPAGGTYHPKLYSASGEERAVVFVGSNNLTAGGLYWNHEAAVVLDIDLTLPEDAAFFQQLDDYFSRLRHDNEVCLRLTTDIVDRLVAQPRYGIRPERRAKDEPTENEAPEDNDSAGAENTGLTEERLFGHSRFGRKRDPRRRRLEPTGDAVTTATAPAVESPGAPPSPVASPQLTVVKRWTKELSRSDAQQKATPTTRVTGNLKLTEAGHQIDHSTYFRDSFFRNLNWHPTQKPRGVLETADVTIEVLVDGVSVGTYSMVVDHAAYRIADQSNVPTWLKWGDFGAFLRQHPQTGKIASLELLSDGSYRLYIQATPTGPFVA